uniref:Radical SAM protein n=1 Tax=candidate division WOR-3 bacterium TaxID=2052148 RepID=A0A7C4U6W6_UNCW3
MGIVFGPVPSRRYGLSLGLDIIPKKTCSFNCIYCEVGLTDNLTIERKPFLKLEDLKGEIDESLKNISHLDVITFSGSGEPTLNSEIGRMIRYLKKNYNFPVVVITNGSLLWMKEVREELSFADIVEPTLNAGKEETFMKISRHDKDIILPLHIEGLIKFREEFKGKYFLELFFVKGVNDDEEDVKKMIEITRKINPDKIHLNTIDRPPSTDCLPVDEEFLLKIKNLLPDKTEILSRFKGLKTYIEIEDFILKTVKVRALKIDDIFSMLKNERKKIEDVICDLIDKGKIKEVIFNGEKYIQGV